MARKIKDHNERKQEFFLVAQQLFHHKGYSKTSVNDILKTMNVAKGTFYHYFSSKEDLLDGLVEMINKNTLDDLRRLVTDPDMKALDKMNAVISISKRWKEANRQIIIAMIKVMCCPENSALLKKMMEKQVALIAPFLTRVIRQGVEEGVFRIPFPEDSGELVLRIGYAIHDMLRKYYLEMDRHPGHLDVIKKKLQLWTYTLERFLGAPEDSIKVAEDGFFERLLDQNA